MKVALLALLNTLSRLPLSVLHWLGCILPFFVRRKSKVYRRLTENIAISHQYSAKIAAKFPEPNDLVRASLQQLGMGSLELARIWRLPSEDILKLVIECEGWEYIAAARQQGAGLVLLTPHLGNYDLAGRFLTIQLAREYQLPLTAMYRPPRLAWLENLMLQGRTGDGAVLVPASTQGVRAIIKALRQGEATMILPDQVPAAGDGVWVNFFGQSAYTMTLASRLANMKNVETLIFYGHRLPQARGFRVVIRPLGQTLSGDKETDVARINLAMESLIEDAPEQYLWTYNRYKRPANAAPQI